MRVVPRLDGVRRAMHTSFRHRRTVISSEPWARSKTSNSWPGPHSLGRHRILDFVGDAMDGPTNGWPSDGSEIWRGGASSALPHPLGEALSSARDGARCMVCRSTPRSKTASLSRYVSGSCSKSRSSMSCDGDRRPPINGARYPLNPTVPPAALPAPPP